MLVPFVVGAMKDDSVLTVLDACRLVASAAVKKRFTTADKAPDFTESLRKTFYRVKKNSNDVQYHGNSKLTKEDEDLLLGITLGMTRCGDSMGAKEIRALAADLFEGITFGDDWYISFLSSSLFELPSSFFSLLFSLFSVSLSLFPFSVLSLSPPLLHSLFAILFLGFDLRFIGGMPSPSDARPTFQWVTPSRPRRAGPTLKL